MFKSKRELDAHVRDLFSKLGGENEKARKCYSVAKLYSTLKEFETSKRYLETYLKSGGVGEEEQAEALRALGEIHVYLNEDVKALEAYQKSYEKKPNKGVLDRVCDLLHQGGQGVEPDEAKKWFDLQKEMSAENNKTVNGNGMRSGVSGGGDGYGNQFLNTLATSRTFFGNNLTPLKSPGMNGASPAGNTSFRNQFQPAGFGNKSQSPSTLAVRTPKQRMGMGTSSVQPSPERMLQQMKFLETKLDTSLERIGEQSVSSMEKIEQCAQTMEKLVEQNSKLFSVLDSITGEIQGLKDRMDNLSLQIKQSVVTSAATTPQNKDARSTGSVAAPQELRPLSEMFKKSVGSWDCSGCYVNNPKEVVKCPACGTLKPGCFEVERKPPTDSSLPIFDFSYKAPPLAITKEQPVANPTFADVTAPKFSFISSPATTLKSSTIATTPPTATTTASTNSFGGFSFSAASNLGFGDLASSATTFSKPLDFKGFGGEAKPLFSSFPSSSANESTMSGRTRTTSENEDDFVPTAEFAPVIPLPPLVEVKRGDENEIAIFTHRAKLYRMDTSEWKERGIGDIKILQDKVNPAAVRVVMWREKVHKLACNFRITGNMKIEFYQNNPKVVLWNAIDYSDDNPGPQTFSCKFSQEEKCGEFKKVFEEMIELAKANPTTPPKKDEAKAAPVPQPELQPLSEMFKKSEGSWDCSGCYVNNPSKVVKCPACGTFKPGCSEVDLKPPTDSTPPSTFNFSYKTPSPTAQEQSASTFTGDVTAPKFSFFSPPATLKSSTIATTPLSSTTSANNSFGGFSFSAASNLGFGDLTSSTSTFSKPLDFKGFENGSLPLFSSFASSTANESTVSSKTRTTSEGEGGEDDFVPTAEFAPVIPLPPLVEVKRGDEDEIAVFTHRAKLYRLDTAEWKERGIGDIKILQDKVNPAAVRVVMWREKVHKLACNFRITGNMKIEFYQNNPKVVLWNAIDYSDDNPGPQTFSCKFSQEEKCGEFKKLFEEMIALAKANPSTTPQKEEAKTAAPATAASPPELRPLSEMFKKSEGSWDCSGCYVNNPPEVVKCPACGTLKPGCSEVDGKPPTDSTPPSTFNFSYKAPSTTQEQPVVNPTTFTGDVTAPKFSFFSPTATLKSSTIAATTPPTTTTTTASANPFASFSFSSASNVGFGDLASSAPTFSKPLDFKGFEGGGKPLFGSFTSSTVNESTASSRTRSTSEGEGGEDDFVPTAEFAPVIPLPPLVEVKRGDEDEIAVYQHRAKLYRLDTAEWKERGIGDIKILQDKVNPASVRVVMWREKVHKLACNFRITGNMKIEFYQDNSKVVLWKAIDYSDDNPGPQTFSCRFSQEEKCREFKKVFEEMIELAKANPSTTPQKEEAKAAPAPQPELQPLSEMFKKSEGSWDCSGCYVNNPPEVVKCPACATLKPGCTEEDLAPAVTAAPAAAEPSPAFTFGFNVLPTVTQPRAESTSNDAGLYLPPAWADFDATHFPQK